MQTTDELGATEVATEAPTEARPPEPAPAPAPVAARGGRRRLAWLVSAAGAAWVVSGVATAEQVDWILLPVVVLSFASVLRVGTTLVDRLMLGGFLTAGAAVVGGLLFSLWPWGIGPFPVAGCLLTAAALIAWW